MRTGKGQVCARHGVPLNGLVTPSRRCRWPAQKSSTLTWPIASHAVCADFGFACGILLTEAVESNFSVDSHPCKRLSVSAS